MCGQVLDITISLSFVTSTLEGVCVP